MKQYYEAVVTYQGADAERVRELYLIKAQTCSDAEYKLHEYLLVSDAKVLSVKVTPISEVNDEARESDESGNAECRWYKCKATLLTVADNGKTRRTPYYYAISATSVEAANTALLNMLDTNISDWEINTITETKIIEYI